MAFTYRGLKAKLARHTVTAEETEQYLQQLLQQTPKITPIQDRPAQLGDEVILDYAGFCEGTQFAGGTAQGQRLELGSGMFIPGFEEQLVGKNIGEEVTVEVTFPESYHAENLAGKAAQFHCKIHEIRSKGHYQLDDEFAQQVGGCETLAQMRQKLTSHMQAYADQRSEMELQDQLLQQAAQTLDAQITQEQLDGAMNEQMQALQAQLAQQGVTVEMYCQFMGRSEEELRKGMEPAARAALQNQAAIDKIIELENLQAEPQEIEDACTIICQENNITKEQLKEYYNDAFAQAVERGVLGSKAMRIIRDNAEITEA